MANVKPIKTPPKRNTPSRTQKQMYRCVCCGGEWSSVDNYFYRTTSAYYEGNKNHIDVCKNCCDGLYDKVVSLYNGDDFEALKYMCQRFDWYFDEHTASTIIVDAGQTKLQAYLMSKKKWVQKKRDLDYFDYIEEVNARGDNIVDGDIEPTITQAMIDRWTNMWSSKEIVILENHFQLLHKSNPNCTGNQETYIKDLCYLHLTKMQALQEKDTDTAIKAMTSYQKTFSASGLKLEEETDDSDKQTLGMTLAMISQYTPEEYYKDKTLFKDYSGIDEYVARHVGRPVMNIVAGTKDRDSEYHVYGDVEGEEGGDFE